MFRCLAELGYVVEWRIINAADYGLPQRRRRTYIFAYKNSTKFAKKIYKKEVIDIFNIDGVFAQSFRISPLEKINEGFDILNSYKDVVEVSDKFKYDFKTAGLLINGVIYTEKVSPVVETPITLGQISEGNV